MKNLIIINNYHDGIPEKRLDGFNEALKSLKNDVSYEFVFFEDLNLKDTYDKVLKADGVILSGSHLFMSESEAISMMRPVFKLIDDFKKPILGICLGHQLIGVKFGFQVADLEIPYFGNQKERILTLILKKPFDLIKSDTITVEMNHQQEIKYTAKFDEIFDLIASSESCRIQILKHKEREIYGVQFHPETICDKRAQQEGRKMIENFINLL